MTIKSLVVRAVLATVLSAVAGAAAAQSPVSAATAAQFADYWYPNGAEISRFELMQARYGEIHAGDAVLIFVTDNMNPDRQVKAERPEASAIPILKLNAVRKFYTGIYPYSMMTSTFAPVDAAAPPLPLKVSSSTQEWCGHVYTQLNLRNGRYRVEIHSYFESEADQAYTIAAALPEDAIWTGIRIAPGRLPVGDISLIPGAEYTRLLHRPIRPVPVTAVLQSQEGRSLEGRPLAAYEVRFAAGDRTLRIVFERDFPHRIQRWTDSHREPDGRWLTTTAERTHTILNAYWQHHRNADRRLLPRLGLDARP
jgi:hypothetical protein